jgi:hypothetical protein
MFDQCFIIKSTAIKSIAVQNDVIVIVFHNDKSYNYKLNLEFLNEILIPLNSVGKVFNNYIKSNKLELI